MSKTQPLESKKRFSITITKSDEQVDEKIEEINHHNRNSLSVPDRHSEKNSANHYPKCKILSEQIVNMLNSNDQLNTTRKGFSNLQVIRSQVNNQANGVKEVLRKSQNRNRKRFCSKLCQIL